MPQTNNQDQNSYKQWFGIGIEFCGAIGVFCYMGYKLDQFYNSAPWCLVGGFFIGFTGMTYLLIKQSWDSEEKK